MSNSKEVEVLSAFVHGALALGHLLGVLYNIRHRNWRTTVFHTAAFTFDLWATGEHYKDRKNDSL